MQIWIFRKNRFAGLGKKIVRNAGGGDKATDDEMDAKEEASGTAKQKA